MEFDFTILVDILIRIWEWNHIIGWLAIGLAFYIFGYKFVRPFKAIMDVVTFKINKLKETRKIRKSDESKKKSKRSK